MPGVGRKIIVTAYMRWTRDDATSDYDGVSGGDPPVRFTVFKMKDHWRLERRNGSHELCQSRRDAFALGDTRAMQANQPLLSKEPRYD